MQSQQRLWKDVDSMAPTLPPYIPGYGIVRPFTGQMKLATSLSMPEHGIQIWRPDHRKRLRNISEAFEACQVRDGAVLSFHHHLRNGDHVLNMVLEVAAKRGLKDLTIAASSLFPIHAPIIEHVRNGVVSKIVTAYVSGPVANAISTGVLPTPVVMQTHGSRALAIQTGKLCIDVTFIAAPSADDLGNLSGAVGRAACGPLGYAMVDAEHARRVVAITDNLVSYPTCPIDISQDKVDFVVTVPSIGDPAGILSGTTRPTTDPVGLQIAHSAAQVIEASGLLGPDFSFQTGAGGISLAVAEQVRELMQRRGIQGAFASGGITGALCDMLEAGLFRAIFDVQCFDLKAVESYRRDPKHMPMSASLYANPAGKGSIVDKLKTMILGAAEIDLNFNVNVSTGSTGRILGGSGGHADTAFGAELAIVTTRLASSSGPKVVERVGCITTPGTTVDVLVTEVGVAVNPLRQDLKDRLINFGIKVLPIEQIQVLAAQIAKPTHVESGDPHVVAVVEYRDGSVLDVIRRTTL